MQFLYTCSPLGYLLLLYKPPFGCCCYSALAPAFSSSKLIFLQKMASDPLSEQILSMRQSFFDEGDLDNQFVEMEGLQDEDEPNFLEEVLTLFFKDANRLLATVEAALEKPNLDFLMLERTLHQYKGTSSSVGACKLLMVCNQTREFLKEGDIEKGKASFQQLKEEHGTLKSKIETYFQLIRQATPVETAQRPA